MSARRVPIRYQLTQTECAPACLAMVLSAFGRHTTVPGARELLAAGRDGATMGSLATAAESAGLLVSVRQGPLQDESFDGLAVAFLARRHFVVVESVSARQVRTVDPAAGRVRLTREEFDAEFGGVLLVLRPGPGLERIRPRWTHDPMVRYLRQLVSAPGGRRLLGIAALLALGLQLAGLVTPLLTKFLVDTVLADGRSDLVLVLGAGAAGTAILAGLLHGARALVLVHLRAGADRILTTDHVRHIFRLPVSFFADRSRGDLLTRLGSISTTREALTQQLLTTALDGLLFLGYLTALLLLAPGYVLLVLPVVVARGLAVTASYRRLGLLARQEASAKAPEQNYLVEALTAVVPLKANGVQERAVEHWSELYARFQEAMVRRGRAASWFNGLQFGVTTFGPLFLLVAGAVLVLDGGITLGTMLAANSLALLMLAPVESFAAWGQLFHTVRAQVERLFDVADTPAEPSGTVRLRPDAVADVVLRGVSFAYPGRQERVLEDVDLAVPAGTKLGVVGRTGSGKSTLALLVLGLLRPEGGTITHGGVGLDDLDMDDLRSRCGVVLQELTLFNGTVRDNLRLRRPSATQEETIEAARLAGLHDDVVALPLGYDTLVGEGGASLSAGQRQRVALARALVGRPRLLVLDEATSHLDPATERSVDEALAGLRVTRIVISHRLSAVRGADEIVVLDRGRIVQRGTHDDLVHDGVYRELFGEPAPQDSPGRPLVGSAPE